MNLNKIESMLALFNGVLYTGLSMICQAYDMPGVMILTVSFGVTFTVIAVSSKGF
jgi:hypothetical protein